MENNQSSQSYGKVVVKVEVGYVLNTTSVFIHAKNKLGKYATPVEIKVRVKYNCIFDRISIN